MNKDLEELMSYVCEELCVHAVEDSDYLVEQCDKCKLKEYGEKLKKNAGLVIIEELKEQQERIQAQIDINDGDLFNRLNQMRRVAKYSNAIELIEKQTNMEEK